MRTEKYCFYCGNTQNLNQEIVQIHSYYPNNKLPKDIIYICDNCKYLIEKYEVRGVKNE